MKNKRIKPPKKEAFSQYHALWRIVDGAVRDAFLRHPEYLTDAGHRSAQLSIVKRVAGALEGHILRSNSPLACGKRADDAHSDEG